VKAESVEGLLLIGMKRRRPAISEVTGTLIMVAITLVAGAAVFGFVNAQSGSSANAVGKSAASNINFLNEREQIVTAAIFGASPSYQAQIWVYNSGSISPENMTSAVVYATASPSNVCAVSLHKQPSALVYAGQISSAITVTIPSAATSGCPSPFQFVSGSSYTFEVIGLYGSTAQLTVGF
jgi:flagellin-like protein